MDETQSDSDEIKPTDPDMKWTGWALDMLRDMVETDNRTKRMTAQQQAQILAGPDAPDYALMQSRLSRSMRLSIAMIERIRADYLMRRARRTESGEQERRRQRREQAADAVAKAVAAPDEAGDVERVRSMVWESLVEDEILDVQLDTLSPEEFLREVCRKIGRMPPSAPPPQGWDDTIVLPGPSVEFVAASSLPGDGWAEPPEESADGHPPPRLPKPDSS
jgi:hypothetical protein